MKRKVNRLADDKIYSLMELTVNNAAKHIKKRLRTLKPSPSPSKKLIHEDYIYETGFYCANCSYYNMHDLPAYFRIGREDFCPSCAVLQLFSELTFVADFSNGNLSARLDNLVEKRDVKTRKKLGGAL